MRRALALLALSGSLLGAPAASLAQTRVPAPPEPTPGPTRAPAAQPAPRTATPAQVDEDSPGWIVPAVIAVAALAVLLALLSLTPLDPARAFRPLGRRASEAGARSSEAFAGLWDRLRITR